MGNTKRIIIKEKTSSEISICILYTQLTDTNQLSSDNNQFKIPQF